VHSLPAEPRLPRHFTEERFKIFQFNLTKQPHYSPLLFHFKCWAKCDSIMASRIVASPVSDILPYNISVIDNHIIDIATPNCLPSAQTTAKLYTSVFDDEYTLRDPQPDQAENEDLSSATGF
jgi:hypothetical protein